MRDILWHPSSLLCMEATGAIVITGSGSQISLPILLAGCCLFHKGQCGGCQLFTRISIGTALSAVALVLLLPPVFTLQYSTFPVLQIKSTSALKPGGLHIYCLVVLSMSHGCTYCCSKHRAISVLPAHILKPAHKYTRAACLSSSILLLFP